MSFTDGSNSNIRLLSKTDVGYTFSKNSVSLDYGRQARQIMRRIHAMAQNIHLLNIFCCSMFLTKREFSVFSVVLRTKLVITVCYADNDTALFTNYNDYV